MISKRAMPRFGTFATELLLQCFEGTRELFLDETRGFCYYCYFLCLAFFWKQNEGSPRVGAAAKGPTNNNVRTGHTSSNNNSTSNSTSENDTNTNPTPFASS